MKIIKFIATTLFCSLFIIIPVLIIRVLSLDAGIVLKIITSLVLASILVVTQIAFARKNKYGIKGYQVKLRMVMANGRVKHKEVFIVDVADHDNLHKYGKFHDHFKEIGLKKEELHS